MNKFAIMTDMTADMPKEFFEENDIDIASMSFSIGDTEYNRDNLIPYDEFYDKLRNGAMPRTSQTDLDDVKSLMAKRLEKGEDVLYLCFSSGVSGSFNNINNIVRRELLEEYPDRKVIVVDTLSGSCGIGMLLYKACKMRSQGKTIDETATWLDENKLNLHHYYVIGDLKLLMKGGRISKTQAILGTIIGIKPIVMLDTKGQNHVVGKVKGKKKAIAQLMKLVEDNINLDDNEFLMTTYSGCKDEADELGAQLKDKFNKEIVSAPLTYLVGSHVGPDTVGVFFFGKTRTP